MKNNRWKYIVSSLIVLLPMAFGLLFWNLLPDHMTTHWGLDGTADGWAGRAFAVCVLPLILLALHWFAVWWTMKDQEGRSQNPKVMALIFWIFPVISLFANGMIYAASLGSAPQSTAFVPLLLGLMFVFIGNYMPKCRQNRTMGVKVKWTLENEENWNATHRVAGRVWFAGGLLLMAGAFLPQTAMVCVLIPVVLGIAVVPIVYSWLYHLKQVKQGTAVIQKTVSSPGSKTAVRITAVAVPLILIFAAALMFTGEISVAFGAESFIVESSYWVDLTVAYDAVDFIEYRETDQPGVRTSGLGSAKLQAGAFRNEEFGNYTRYSYTGCDACIVLKADGKVLVLNARDAQATKALFDTLQSHLQ